MSADKREHIITTAMKLFAEKGFEGTSIRDIASETSVNIAMVNYYFGSKEKLFEKMIEHKSIFTRERLEDIANDKTTTEIEKIELVIEYYVERLLSNPNYHRLIQMELLLKLREEIHGKLIANFTENTHIVTGIIEQGIKKKHFKKVDAELTFASIIGTINQIMLSKKLCIMIMDMGADFDPLVDSRLKKRLLTHLKQIIHSYLLLK
jgi:AcrR family transcriptional regulator